MDLAKVTLVMRPRGPWEGIDLGFAMACRWFLPLWGLWWAVALPFAIGITLVFPDKPWLIILLLWWGKPLYEPLVLFWLSRTLFGEQLGWRASLRHWRAIMRAQPLAYLTWRRFTLSRSFYMPVGLLEGKRGADRRARIAVLGRGQSGGFWLTLVAFHFEMLLQLSLLVLCVIALPEELQWLDWGRMFIEPGPLELWLQTAVDLLGMSLIAPFFVTAGFTLYLTRRSELEAWDIEIGFRRLRERARRPIRRMAAWLVPLLGAGLLAWVKIPVAEAGLPPQSQAREWVDEVLADPAFGHMEETGYWKYLEAKDDEEAANDDGFWDWLSSYFKGFGKTLAAVGEFLLWGAAGGLIAYLLYRARATGFWRPAERASQAPAAPTGLFGLDLTRERLPADPAGEARRLLGAERPREALSLLYRASLAALLARQLEIAVSATEGECLALVRARRPADEAELFQHLTRAWVGLAYGHRLPPPERMESLCRDWDGVFGRGSPPRA